MSRTANHRTAEVLPFPTRPQRDGATSHQANADLATLVGRGVRMKADLDLELDNLEVQLQALLKACPGDAPELLPAVEMALAQIDRARDLTQRLVTKAVNGAL